MKSKNLLSPFFIIALLAFIIIGGGMLFQNKRNQQYRARYQEVNAMLRDSQYTRALQVLKEVYPHLKSETRIEALYQIGLCHQKMGEPGKAEKYWKEVLASRHSFYHPVIYYELAKNRLKEKNFEKAQFYYSKIIDNFPSHSLAVNAALGPVDIYISRKEFEKAREYCQGIIENPDFPLRIKEIAFDKLGEINIKMLFSPTPTEISEFYTVKTGDSLSSIARKFNTTIPLLMRANNLADSVIKPEQKLKITINKFSLLVHVDKHDLFLNYDNKLFKRYKIAVGAHETPTLPGVFEIREKLKDPTWYPTSGGVIAPGSPENLLGSRWLGLWQSGKRTSYGIHEAIDPSDIGKYISNGCIRMFKDDLEELYDIVTIGSKVIIKDKE